MINVREIAGEIEEKIKNIYGNNLSKIMIYGSYANGIPDDESDVDIIAPVSDNEETIEKNRKLIADIVAEMSSIHNVFISVMIRNDKLFYERSKYVPFYMNVISQGITIHG